jgi:hypothetical protein
MQHIIITIYRYIIATGCVLLLNWNRERRPAVPAGRLGKAMLQKEYRYRLELSYYR